jgi:hypothetical protein
MLNLSSIISQWQATPQQRQALQVLQQQLESLQVYDELQMWYRLWSTVEPAVSLSSLSADYSLIDIVTDFATVQGNAVLMSYSEVEDSLIAGYPILLCLKWRGSLLQPEGEHWVLCYGKTYSGGYTFIDQWGSLNESYKDCSKQRVIYSRELLQARWGAVRGLAKAFVRQAL